MEFREATLYLPTANENLSQEECKVSATRSHKAGNPSVKIEIELTQDDHEITTAGLIEIFTSILAELSTMAEDGGDWSY